MEGLEINLQESNFRDHIAIYKGSRYIGIIVEFSKEEFTKMLQVFSLKFYDARYVVKRCELTGNTWTVLYKPCASLFASLVPVKL